MKIAITEAFHSVSDLVQQTAEAAATDHYGYRPTDDVRTLCALIAHIVDGHRYYCAHARGSTVEWSDAVERQAPDPAEAVRLLRASIEDCTAALAADEVRLGPMIDNLAHTNLHYGNLVTYVRELGITPPSSQPH